MRSGLGRAVRRAMTANGVTRRRVLAGAVALPFMGASACARVTRDNPVVIVGGGLAGLCAALRLADAGVPAQVYEASPRLGGRVKTSVLGDGLLVEEGAEFIDADHPEMLGLCRRFNLPLFNRATAPLPSGVPRTAYVFGGVVQDPEELALSLEPLARRIEADLALLDEDEDIHAPRIDALSAAQYLDAIPLDPSGRWIAETTIRTEYGVEPEESSALQLVYSLPGVDTGGPETDEAFTLEGGNQGLIEAIAAALPLPPILNRRMSAEDAAAAPAVVIAVPPRAVGAFAGLSPLTHYVSLQSLGRNEKLIAAFRGRPWRESVFGVEAVLDGVFASAWDATLRQEGADGALTLFSGGDIAAAAVTPNRRLQELWGAFPGIEPAATGETLATRWGEERLIGGAYTSFAPGEMTHPERVYWGRGKTVIDGRIAFAGEHLSESHYGYMEGAAQTGRLAAEAVLRALNR